MMRRTPSNPQQELHDLKEMLTKALHELQKQGSAPALTPDQENAAINHLATGLMNVKSMNNKQFTELLKPDNLNVLLNAHAQVAENPQLNYLTENHNLMRIMLTDGKLPRELDKVLSQFKADTLNDFTKLFGPESTKKPAENMMAMKNEQETSSEPTMNNPSFKAVMADFVTAQQAKLDPNLRNLFKAEFGTDSLENTSVSRAPRLEVAELDQILAQSDEKEGESLQEKTERRMEEDEIPSAEAGAALEEAADLGLSILAPTPEPSSSESDAEEEVEEEHVEEQQAENAAEVGESDEEEAEHTAMRRPSPFRLKPHK